MFAEFSQRNVNIPYRPFRERYTFIRINNMRIELLSKPWLLQFWKRSFDFFKLIFELHQCLRSDRTSRVLISIRNTRFAHFLQYFLRRFRAAPFHLAKDRRWGVDWKGEVVDIYRLIWSAHGNYCVENFSNCGSVLKRKCFTYILSHHRSLLQQRIVLQLQRWPVQIRQYFSWVSKYVSPVISNTK